MKNFRFKVIQLDIQRQFGTRKVPFVPVEDLFMTIAIDTDDENFDEDGNLTAIGLGQIFERLEVSLIESTDF